MRALVVVQPGDGHLNPLVPFAEALRTSGHELLAGTSPSYVPDVVLCHGGLGSVLGAMEAGCPLVIVPLGGDHLHNAAKARELGIARVVDLAETTPDRLCGEIELAMGSSEQRQASGDQSGDPCDARSAGPCG